MCENIFREMVKTNKEESIYMKKILHMRETFAINAM